MAPKKYIKWTDQLFKEKSNEIQPNIEVIGNYIKMEDKILCKCKIHDYQWEATPYPLLKGVGCPICGLDKISQKKRTSNEEYVKRLRDTFPYLIPLEEYKTSTTPMKFKCLKCNKEFTRTPNGLFHSLGCECQLTKKLIVGVNDFKTKCPDLVKFLYDESDAEKYAYRSSKKIKTKCPLCGHVHKMKVHQLSVKGFNCPVCGDHVSFPNKFGRAFVEQLPVKNILHEKMLNIPGHKFRFDTYFEYDNQKYAIEFDGVQHYEEVGLGRLEQQKELDSIKDTYAKENKIILIRIDCRKSEPEYIKNNILNSCLNNIFDLSKIDWNLCNITALKSLTKEICDKYNSTKMSIKELSEAFHLSKSTIESRLKTGTNLGFTDYYSEENINIRRKNGSKETAKKLGKEVIVFYPNGKIYKTFESIRECTRQMSVDFNIKFNSNSISKICKHKSKKDKYNGFKYMFLTEYNSLNNLNIAI